MDKNEFFSLAVIIVYTSITVCYLFELQLQYQPLPLRKRLRFQGFSLRSFKFLFFRRFRDISVQDVVHVK